MPSWRVHFYMLYVGAVGNGGDLEVGAMPERPGGDKILPARTVSFNDKAWRQAGKQAGATCLGCPSARARERGGRSANLPVGA